MSTNDRIRRRQDDAARDELRRLVSNRQPPSDVEAEAFGPWEKWIAPLRAAYYLEGPDACRAQFLEKAKENPRLCALVSGDPRPEPAERKLEWTWDDVQTSGFPPRVWVVPDIILAGLGSIGGRPKIGKSWLALQIACAVGTGGQIFGREVKRGKVLYLALEDSPRRLKMRGERQHWPDKVNVTFWIEWPYLARGGIAGLRKEIEAKGYTLVIVDTLTRALGRTDQMDLAETALVMGELQRLAQQLDVSILLVDHHRKPNGFQPDPVDDLMGSTGKALPLDGVCGLYRQRGKKEATLHVTGRDLDEIKLPLVFDGLTCTWILAEDQGGMKRDGAEAAVLAAIREITAAGELAYSSRVADLLDKDRSNVGRAIVELLRLGLIQAGERQGNIIPLYVAGEQAAPAVKPLRDRVTQLFSLAALRDATRGQATSETSQQAQQAQVQQQAAGAHDPPAAREDGGQPGPGSPAEAGPAPGPGGDGAAPGHPAAPRAGGPAL